MQRKKYTGTFQDYEDKLARVMTRLGIEKYDYNWSKDDCYIEFFYKNQLYRFEHSLKKAEEQGIKYVSDLFAQLVYTLEDISRMTERGIYELSTWIEGMKALPPQKDIPKCFITLGLEFVPDEFETVKSQYRELVRKFHPDKGGSASLFNTFTKAYNEAKEYFNIKEDK